MESSGPLLEHQLACDQCGRFGAYQFDGRALCGGCYESSGSCCPEFVSDEEAADAD